MESMEVYEGVYGGLRVHPIAWEVYGGVIGWTFELDKPDTRQARY